jgi:sugar phosphate isomerase/epimerase
MRIPGQLAAQGFSYTVQWAAKVGLEVLDVGALTPEMKQLSDICGLQIGSVDAKGVKELLSKDDLKREAASIAIKRQIDEIASIGANILFMCLVPEDLAIPRRETFELWKDTFPELVKHAEQRGVYIAIEGWPGPAPHYPTIGCTPEMWRAMFEAVPSKHFGLNYDPSHLVWLGIDYLRALSEFGDRVNHCHGKDTQMLAEERYASGVITPTFGIKYSYSGGFWRYTIPGHGEIRWDRVAEGLDRAGYAGAICIELEDHHFKGSLEKEQLGIQRAYEHLIRYFR